MKVFIETEAFRALNVGFHMDEGLASPNDTYKVYNAERCPMSLLVLLLREKHPYAEAIVTCPGNPGHGSLYIENNAGEKIVRLRIAFSHLSTICSAA